MTHRPSVQSLNAVTQPRVARGDDATERVLEFDLRHAQRIVTSPVVPFVAVGSARGGSGKTTLSAGLGHTFARRFRLRMGLLDLDPQGGLSDYCGHATADDPLHEPPVSAHGMQLYRGGRALAHAPAAAVTQHVGRVVAGAGEDAASVDRRPALVLADLSPAPTDVPHHVLFTARPTLLLVVTGLDTGGLRATRELTALADACGVPYRIVCNFGRRWLVTGTVLKHLRAQYGSLVLDPVVPADVRAAESPASGAPVTVTAPQCRASQAIRALATELLPILGLAHVAALAAETTGPPVTRPCPAGPAPSPVTRTSGRSVGRAGGALHAPAGATGGATPFAREGDA
jgi:chromosome partitioning protein